MAYEELYEKKKHVILNVGDMIYDLRSDSAGILVNRERRVDMVKDDVYMWQVKWIRSKDIPDVELPLVDYVEEEGLKMSIVIGLTQWHSIDGGTYEP